MENSTIFQLLSTLPAKLILLKESPKGRVAMRGEDNMIKCDAAKILLGGWIL